MNQNNNSINVSATIQDLPTLEKFFELEKEHAQLQQQYDRLYGSIDTIKKEVYEQSTVMVGEAFINLLRDVQMVALWRVGKASREDIGGEDHLVVEAVTISTQEHTTKLGADVFEAISRALEVATEQAVAQECEACAQLAERDDILDLSGGSTGNAKGTAINIARVIRARNSNE